MQGSLPAGWLTFAGRELNPLDRDERFQNFMFILLPRAFPVARIISATRSGGTLIWRASSVGVTPSSVSSSLRISPGWIAGRGTAESSSLWCVHDFHVRRAGSVPGPIRNKCAVMDANRVKCHAMTQAVSPRERAEDVMLALKLVSTITCPFCGHQRTETMPTDARQYFYECHNCKALLKPRAGDCCVFCSFGDAPCPPIQEARASGRRTTCCS